MPIAWDARPVAELTLAVLISGQARLTKMSSARGHLAATLKNDVLKRSPAETWEQLKRGWRAARTFACTDHPLTEEPWKLSFLTRGWVFEATSQFSRFRECLLRVEAAHPHGHSAFLRIRPDFLVLAPLRQPVSLDTFYGMYYYYPSGVGKTLRRDQVSCGMCDQGCECAQRKYGQLLFAFKSATCSHPIVTDQAFLFGRMALPKLLRVLSNYSEPTPEHPARNISSDRHCIVAGRMVEAGFSRLLEDERIPVRPLSLRGVLERSLQRSTPGWSSAACMLTWPHASPAPMCTQDCGNASVWLRRHGMEVFPTLRPAGRNGCNAVSRHWYPSWEQG
jgi:hypothetical protein